MRRFCRPSRPLLALCVVAVLAARSARGLRAPGPASGLRRSVRAGAWSSPPRAIFEDLEGADYVTDAAVVDVGTRGFDDNLGGAAVAVGLAAAAGAALGAFNLGVYLRMQYVTAALLSRRLPSVKGGADVLELSAVNARNLYYLRPGGVKRVILSATPKSKLSEGFAEAAGAQAQIPTVTVRDQDSTLTRLDVPDGILDAVVSVGGFMASNNAKGAVSEIARILKPNGTLLMVEPGTCELLIEELMRKLGDDVEVQRVQNLFKPYTVAVATKKAANRKQKQKKILKEQGLEIDRVEYQVEDREEGASESAK